MDANLRARLAAAERARLNTVTPFQELNYHTQQYCKLIKHERDTLGSYSEDSVDTLFTNEDTERNARYLLEDRKHIPPLMATELRLWKAALESMASSPKLPS